MANTSMGLSLGSETKVLVRVESTNGYYVPGIPCILHHKNLCDHCSIDTESCVFFLKGKEVMCDWKVYQFSMKTGD